MSGKKIARIAVALVALTVVVATFVLSHAAEHLTGRLLLAMLLVQPLNGLSILSAASRLKLLSKGVINLWSAAKAQSLAIFALYVFPTRASEVIKPLYLADRHQIPLSRALAIVFCERLSDLFIMAVFVLGAAAYLAGGVAASALPYWAFLVAAIILFCLIVVRRPQLLTKLIGFLPWKRVAAILDRLLSEARSVLDPQSIPLALCLGAGAWLSSYIMTYIVLLHAGSYPVGLGGALFVFLAGTAGLVVAVAPAGLGTFEGAIILALGIYGYPFSEALAAAIALRLASVVPSLLIAIYVLAHEKTGLHGLTQRMRGFYRDTQSGNAGGGG